MTTVYTNEYKNQYGSSIFRARLKIDYSITNTSDTVSKVTVSTTLQAIANFNVASANVTYVETACYITTDSPSIVLSDGVITSNPLASGAWGHPESNSKEQLLFNKGVNGHNNSWPSVSSSSWTDCGTYTYTINVTRTHSAQHIYILASDPGNYDDNTHVYCAVWGGGETHSGNGYLTSNQTITIPAKTSYTVSFNANSGSGAPSAQTKWHGENLTLSSTKPTRSSYSFWHWNTNTSNTGTTYNSGASYTVNAAATLYAIWNPVISYNANGGSGAPSAQTKTYGTNLTLSSTVPTRTNYQFYHWNTATNNGGASYSSGGTYTSNTAATLYAIWNPEISYDANGGSGAPSTQLKTYGTVLTLSSTVPTRPNHEFKGWGTSPENTTVVYYPGDTYTSNDAVTLYAVWERLKPVITVDQAVRCDENGQADIYGGCLLVTGTWDVTNPAVDPSGLTTPIQMSGEQTLSDGAVWTLRPGSVAIGDGTYEILLGAKPTAQSHDISSSDHHAYPQYPVTIEATFNDGVFVSEVATLSVPAASTYTPPTISVTSAWRGDELHSDALSGNLYVAVSYTRNVKSGDLGNSTISLSVKDTQSVETMSGSMQIAMSSSSGSAFAEIGSNDILDCPPDQQMAIEATVSDWFDTATVTYTLPADPGYFPPEIGVVSVERCDSDGYADDLGEHLKVTMGYRMYNSVSDYVSTLYLLDGLDVADIEAQEESSPPSFEPVSSIEGTENPSEEGWYEPDGQGGYVPSTDHVVVLGKQYYVLVSGSVYGASNPSPTRGSYDTWTVIVGYAPYMDSSAVVQSTGPIDPVVQYVVRAKITDGYKTIYSDRTVAVSPYYPPYISFINVFRCDQHGEFEDDGMYAAAELGWGIYPTRSQTRPKFVTVDLLDSNGDLVSTDDFTAVISTTSGTDTILVVGNDNVSQDSTYLVRVTIDDKHNSVTAGDYIYTAYFPMDFLAGGHGVAFGKPASQSELMDVGYNIHSDGEVEATDASNNLHKLTEKLSKSGDTLTGKLTFKASDINRDAADPSSDQWNQYLDVVDADGEAIARISSVRRSDGRIGLNIGAYNEDSSGNEVGNGLHIAVAKDGTCSYGVSNADNFRSAIGAFASSGGNITGDTSLSTGKLLTVDKVQSRTRSISYIAGAKGDAALYCPKTYNVNAWYPAVCLETKGGGSWQIGNYDNEYLQFVYATKANRDSSTNTTIAVNLPNTGGTLALLGNTIRAVHANNYWGFGLPDGTTGDWIRTTTSGIIPYQSGGKSSLGTSSWPFNEVWTKKISGFRAVLYNNGTGTNGTVTLSASAADYNHMRIHYRSNNSYYGSVDVYVPNGKKVYLCSGWTNGSSYGETSLKTVTINAKTITNDSYGVWSNTAANGNNYIYIYRVEAWNE